ncbi:hypothetical protein WJX79_004877 [Trebouxia sp. C0005]
MGVRGLGIRGMLAILLLISLGTSAAAGPLMAVDLGSEFIKVAVVPPGKLPEIVTNEMTKRRTSAQVAVVDGNRLLGEEAAALSIRYPSKVFSRLRDLLGKSPADSSIEDLQQSHLLPYSIEADSQRGTIAVSADDGSVLSSEQLVGSILHYAKGITEAFAGAGEIRDCVITVPSFFGQSQRQAIIDSARLAGLTVMSLINNHAAAALQHGYTRTFGNKSENVIFYDIGASSVEAALVKYSSFEVKEGGKMNTHSQFEMKDVAWDASLGVQDLDMLLVNHFADQFETKHVGSNTRSNPRAVAKLKRQARRTKEILSANTEAPFIVEELLDGRDFRSGIKRQDFEDLAGNFFERAAKPLQHLLQRNGLSAGDVHAVELLGGGSRIPKLQAELGRVLHGRVLDKHLDADEAIVRGAAWYAANLSTTFRLNKKFGMSDGAPYPIVFKLDESTQVKQGEEEAAFKEKAVLPFMKRLPIKRVVHLPNITADPIKFSLQHNTSQGSPLPPGVTSPEMAHFVVTGVDSTLSKYNTTGKMGVHLSADSSGILRVDKAESVIEVWEEYEVDVPVETLQENVTVEAKQTLEGGSETDAEGEDVDTATADANDPPTNDTAAKPAVTTRKEMRSRKKTFRVPLTVGGPGFAQPPMSAEQLKTGRQQMQQLQQAEVSRAQAAQAKNELEAYIISTQGWLADDEGVEAVTTDKQRQSFQSELSKVEDWLYDQGEHEQAPVFREKLSQLRTTGDAIFFRVSELQARPEALRLARQFVDLTMHSVQGWSSTKPWINATDTDSLLAELQGFTSWMSEEEVKQSKVKAHDEPVLESSTISARLVQLKHAFERLNKKKKPAPPPVIKPEVNATDDKQTAEPEEADSHFKAEVKPDAQPPNSKDSRQEGQKGSSKSQDKRKTGKQDSKAKAKANAKTSDQSKKPGKGKGKDKNRDIEDLKSKLPPGIKTFDFNDFKDLDMESLKTKLEGMNGDKQGSADAVDHDEL